MGTYVPQRVAKLSRAISRLQRRNAGGGKRDAGGMGLEKETRKRDGEEERKREGERKRKRPAEAGGKRWVVAARGEGGERGREEMARWSLSVGKRN